MRCETIANNALQAHYIYIRFVLLYQVSMALGGEMRLQFAPVMRHTGGYPGALLVCQAVGRHQC